MQDAAIGIVVSRERKNEVLWVKRCDIPIWVLPGGGIEPGESPEEAMKREVREECGLDVTLIRKAAHYSPVNRWTRDTHIFVCSADADPCTHTAEVSEVGFFPISRAPSPHFPLHADWLQEAFKQPTTFVERPMVEFSWKRVGLFLLQHPLMLMRYLFLRLFVSCILLFLQLI
jgi:8-oxo-dGTP diphosphatase